MILIKFLASSEWRNLPASLKSKSDINNATIYSYDYTDLIKVIQIPLRVDEGESSLVVYASFPKPSMPIVKFLATIGKKNTLENGLMHVQMSSVEGNVYYEMKINNEGKIGDFQVLKEMPIRDITFPNPGPNERHPCLYNTFNKCMNCAVKECSENWICALACSIHWSGTLGCFAGFGISCGFL